MRNRRTERLSGIEQEVVREIRELRNSSNKTLPPEILRSPAQLMHHFIRAYRGNVQLRVRPIAAELGIEMRTLERAFTSQFGKTMAKCQSDVRLEFSYWMLSISPPAKIDVIATLLGYEKVQDFNRFFRARTGLSPRVWRSAKRDAFGLRHQDRS